MHTTYLTINLTKVKVDCLGITTIAEHMALVVVVHGWEHPIRAVLIGDPAQRVHMLMKIPSGISSPLLTEQQWKEVRAALIFSEENTRRCVEIMTTHIRGQ